MARVHVYYTGGTIGMVRNSEGRFVPDPGFPVRMRRALLTVPGLPEWDIHVRQPRLLDSSNMTPKDWLEIAQYIQQRHEDYDAFVILHGTDTMAYTTSALTFMIEGLRKPVIFTGSQIPLSEPRNDARTNLIATLLIAGLYREHKVCLFFKDRLLLGCRATKVSATEPAAFDSPNLRPLARFVKRAVKFDEPAPAPPAAAGADVALSVQEITDTKVGLLRLFPGISPAITRNLLQPPLVGAVLQAYGVGNAPSGEENAEFQEVLREAAQRGVLVACTQCLRGSVSLGVYETGLGRLGVVSGYDMTVEAAVTKLFWLLNRGLPLPEVRRQMALNLKGELTPPPPPPDRSPARQDGPGN